MPAPAKPKKNHRNQPIHFKETFASTAPPALATPALPALPPIGPRALRASLIAIWATATILGGVGLGRLIATRIVVPVTSTPIPVAKASLAVAPVAGLPAVSVAPAVTRPEQTLAVAPASAIAQAQSGTPFHTASSSFYQTADSTLQPGFTPFTQAQGSIGTTPVH